MDLAKILKGGLKTVANIATGGLAGQVFDIVEDVLGPDVPPQKKAEMKIAIERMALARENNAHRAAMEAEAAVTRRAAQLEGTAKDLLALPVVGRLIIFLRGLQRPVWGFGVLYLDFKVFSGMWVLHPATMTETAFFIVNLLVLGFLFGERAIKNVAPLIIQLLGRGKGS